MDAVGRWSLSPELKITVALRMLASDLQKLLRKASQRGFPGIIAQSTVCTGSGGIVLLRGQGNSLVMFIDLQLCSRRLRGTTHGYGMHTSARRGHLTTSIF
ncbi:hypothetical protein LINPERPRIM_LOCUS28101 [Linum perenne]